MILSFASASRSIAVLAATSVLTASAIANDVPSPAVSLSVGTIDVGRGFQVTVSGRPLTPFALAVSLYPGSVHTRYGTLCLNPRRAFVIQDGIFRRNDPPLDDTGHYDRSLFVANDHALLGRAPTFQAIVVDPNAPRGLSLSRSETRVVGNGSRGDFRGPVISFFPGQQVYRAISGDIDEDGDVDLIIARPSGITLLLNEGTGSFVDGTDGPTTGIPTGARQFGAGDFADVDTDGDLDLVCYGPGPNLSTRIRLLINDGHGLFTDGTDGETTGTPPTCCFLGATTLLVGNFNGDGASDLIVFEGGQIFLNNGRGRFRDGTLGPGSGWASPPQGYRAAIGDFDGDGDWDIVTTIPGGPPTLYLNDGNAFFTDGTNGPSTGLPPFAFDTFIGVLAGDLDGDGNLDLIMNTLGGQTRAWMNQGSGYFVDETFGGPNGAPPRMPLRTSLTYGAVLIDADRDGDLDLYLSNWLDGRNLLYLNDGRGFFTDSFGGPQSGASLTWSIGWRASTADFDGDGDLDILSDGYGDFGQGVVELAILVNR